MQTQFVFESDVFHINGDKKYDINAIGSLGEICGVA